MTASDLESDTAAEVAERSRLEHWWHARTEQQRRLLSWSGPVGVTLLAAFLRLWNLGHPQALVFDETYYVKDAWTLWNLGYEGSWPEDPNPAFEAGQTGIFSADPSFVVHPPLGKWIIGLGMVFDDGQSAFGWRITTALVGIAAVVLLMLIAKRLTGSLALGTLAGFLLAIDGNAIVMSRVAILDNSVMLFALLGFGAILLDRRSMETQLALWAARTTDRDWGPALWRRPWLLAAGVTFGLCASVKWNGLYFLAILAVYTVVVDALARRRLGVPFWLPSTLLKQAPVSFLLTVPAALAVYLLTWTGWFATDGGYSRTWADDPRNAWTGAFAWVPLPIQSFLHYEQLVYGYHVTETDPHNYQANPLTWLLLIRPTSMYYLGSDLGQNGCEATRCGEWISGIANPLIWWASVAAAGYLVYRLIRRREWQVGLVLAALAAGYLPWLMYLNRTVFQFYTIAFEPYLILALTIVLGLVAGRPTDPLWRRQAGRRVIAVFLVASVLVSAFFYPVWTGIQVPTEFIRLHYWLPTWL
ncbi:dolichyl-phosphate-mannose--protein mannosyltransferase [Herbiconiux sp. SYSU D00978]|uniref:dolichyl-phosphate-mannose--protein mannosyltransferase n=1 Tax=Herbiconiux sp. SYSU D00978 TaxID=2812562 RepID=UPI001A96FDC1|nr:phospholipid carrier-dependent glycosyltransferase [Herbiconiux sp. SYSU D00978]